MASIYKRGKTWTANVFVTIDGTRKRKTKSGFTTKAEANKWAVDVEHKKINDILVKKDGQLLKCSMSGIKYLKNHTLRQEVKLGISPR